MAEIPAERGSDESALRSAGGSGIPSLWGWRTWASLAIAFTALTVMAFYVDFRAMWRELLAADKRFVLLGFAAHYATYYFRGARWKFVLGRTPRRASRLKYGLVVFFYNFIDNLVPAKLGDVYGAHLARINFGIRRSEALGSLVFLRMIDGWIVLGLAAVSCWMLFADDMPPIAFWALLFGVVFAVGATVVMIVSAMLSRSMPAWVPERAVQMVRDFRQRMLPRRAEMSGIIVFTVIIWLLEGLWIYSLILAFGIRPGLTDVVFLTMVPLLASAIPITPAGAGFVEFTLYACLLALPSPFQLTKATAASITFLNRLIDYWLHIVLGIVAWGFRYRLGLYSWRERDFEG
jgi:uncharacterized protein (TIRG00374 family)